MLKDTKSDTWNKRPLEMAQSDWFPSNAAQKKEQYHKWLKGRIRASMKLDDNGDYDNDRKSLGFGRYCR